MTSDKGSNEEVSTNEEDGITIDASEGITMEEYTVAIGKLIGPSNIRFASKNTDGEMCFYLNSQKTISKLLDAHKHVKIGDKTLELRSMIPRYKMIVMSNISPFVPHSVIEDKFVEINVIRRSSIYFMTAGIKEPGYEHVRSFKRYVYIYDEDINKLTTSMEINFKDTVYQIHWQELQGRDLYVKEINTLEQKLIIEQRTLQLQKLSLPLSNATVADKIIHEEEQGKPFIFNMNLKAKKKKIIKSNEKEEEQQGLNEKEEEQQGLNEKEKEQQGLNEKEEQGLNEEEEHIIEEAKQHNGHQKIFYDREKVDKFLDGLIYHKYM